MTSAASGRSFSRIAASASGLSSTAPLVATITGSMTAGISRWARRKSATTPMIPAE